MSVINNSSPTANGYDEEVKRSNLNHVTWCSPRSRIWHVKIAVEDKFNVWFYVLVNICGRLFSVVINLITN